MVLRTFDRFWDKAGEKKYGKLPKDGNSYTTGVIGNHNVVLAYMSDMGSNNAAIVAQGLRTSFLGIDLAFIVGVCGVVPIHTETRDVITLGDCVISTAVIQYDLGRQHPNGFKRKTSIDDSLGRANLDVRRLIRKLKVPYNKENLTERLVHHLEALQKAKSNAQYPGVQQDRLFPTTYIHQHQNGETCNDCLEDVGVCTRDCASIGCEGGQARERQQLQSIQALPDGTVSDETINTQPTIHFGRFGSANTVMKSGSDRDRIAEEGQLAAFEMEGSGIWEVFPTIVIKSACDYADSHKNKKWQPYAAATAAAGLKALLEELEVDDELTRSGKS